MTLFTHAIGVDRLSSHILMLLTATLVKGLIVYAVVRLFLGKSRGLSPAHRHLFWFFAVASCLLIPVLSLTFPPLRVADPLLSGARRGARGAFLSVLLPKESILSGPIRTPGAVGSPAAQAVGRIAAGGAPAAGGIGAAAAAVPAGGVRVSAAAGSGGLPAPSFAFWALCVWAAGAAFLLSAILAGTAKLKRIVKGAGLAGGTRFSRALESLGSAAAGGRRVRIMTSGMCKVPFAWGVVRPVVMFPEASSRWPEGRIRAVLAHELAHVRRMDYLTRLVSRAVCSVFWFAPHLWAAHGSLHVEQEKAADALTVRAGTKPADYARHLLDLARILRRPDPLRAGLFALGYRKSALELRVVHILRMRTGGDDGVPRRFFTPRSLKPFALCILCALSFLFLNPAFNGAHVRTPAPAALALEKIAGTWIQEASEGQGQIREINKFVVNADGSAEIWYRVENICPNHRGYYTVEKAWTEPDGCLYCQTRRKRTAGAVSVSTELWRLDRSGMVLENVVMDGTLDEFPDRIDPGLTESGHVNYIRYTRGGSGEAPGAPPGDAADGGMEN